MRPLIHFNQTLLGPFSYYRIVLCAYSIIYLTDFRRGVSSVGIVTPQIT